jgi:hypothetical protein
MPKLRALAKRPFRAGDAIVDDSANDVRRRLEAIDEQILANFAGGRALDEAVLDLVEDLDVARGAVQPLPGGERSGPPDARAAERSTKIPQDFH